jgi:hypothetical protein
MIYCTITTLTTRKTTICSTFSDVARIVFTYTDTQINTLAFSANDVVDCSDYRLVGRSVNVGGMIIDKGNPKYWRETS